jgi:hypothetical protein
MSLLPPEVHTALSQLLRALSTPDNAVRSQAEEQLNNDWVQNRPDVLLMGLVEQIEGAEDTIVSRPACSFPTLPLWWTEYFFWGRREENRQADRSLI